MHTAFYRAFSCLAIQNIDYLSRLGRTINLWVQTIWRFSNHNLCLQTLWRCSNYSSPYTYMSRFFFFFVTYISRLWNNKRHTSPNNQDYINKTMLMMHSCWVVTSNKIKEQKLKQNKQQKKPNEITLRMNQSQNCQVKDSILGK